MENVKIFVIAHKKIEEKLNNVCIPIQVGYNENLGYIRDNIGDNISEKNRNYCELTGMYWLWKNYKLPEYIGLCHYRRFFVYGKFIKRKINEKQIKRYFEECDIVLPKKYKLKKSMWNYYFENGEGKEKDLINTKKIIKEKYPEYIETFEKIMKKKDGYYRNMFIMKKEDFKRYCEWLFDILFELEKITDLTDYNVQEARIYGYISERLLNVWVEKNRLKIGECEMQNTEKKILYRIKRKFKKILKGN